MQQLTQVLCYCCAWAFLEAWSLIFFLFHHVFLLKVFGIFALVCDKNSNRHKAWERCRQFLKNNHKIMMTKFYNFFLFVLFVSCNGQIEEDTIYFNKDFNWTIKLPKEYEKMNNSEWNSKVEEGGKALENNNDVIFENQTSPIFIFKINAQNYFESTKMPYNINKNGELKDYLTEYNQIQFNTFKSAKPGLKIDTISTSIKIDNLIFNKSEMIVSPKENSTKILLKVIS